MGDVRLTGCACCGLIVGVSCSFSAQDMSAILEAYWLLAAKRFVDNVCMTLDKKIMGAMAHKMQGRRT